jgi:PHD/YefM family antitoxin component YafN of YafNO toxin-antitoxin module
MPKIIPIRELKNTASITRYVEDSDEPVFVTKNGYGTLVIMNMEVYERELANRKMIRLINDSLRDVGETDKKIDGTLFLNDMKTKYGK